MSEPILHHYPASPYAEKIRLMLGFKDLAWKSVIIPAIMPKPDVIALTGGYRRTPILQVGADVYCDTALIERVLERLKPAPTFWPFGDTLAVQALSHFSEAVLFNVAIPIAFQPEAMKIFFPDATPGSLARFRDDRAAMRKGGTVRRGTLGECRAVYAQVAPRIDAQFADGRAFLLGGAPCAADFALYHSLWPIARVPALAPVHAPSPRLVDWMSRMAAIGHGKFREVASGKALEIAKGSKPDAIGDARVVGADDLRLGDEVEAMPVDYALDPVRGVLVQCSEAEIAVRREDARAGTVVVHFPRLGFQVRKAG